jgi:hypothetical protein
MFGVMMKRYEVLLIGALAAVAVVAGVHAQKERALTGARYTPVKAVVVKDNRDCIETVSHKYCKPSKPFTGKLVGLN